MFYTASVPKKSDETSDKSNGKWDDEEGDLDMDTQYGRALASTKFPVEPTKSHTSKKKEEQKEEAPPGPRLTRSAAAKAKTPVLSKKKKSTWR